MPYNPKQTIAPGDGDPRHGTEGGYNVLGCRCDDCTAIATGHRKMRYRRAHPGIKFRPRPNPNDRRTNRVVGQSDQLVDVMQGRDNKLVADDQSPAILAPSIAGRSEALSTRRKSRRNRGVRMHPDTVSNILKEVNEQMAEKTAPKKKRGPRRPTRPYVREAVAANIGRDLTSATVQQWVRREHGVSLRPGSISGALAELVDDSRGEFVLTRIALGVYHVEAARQLGSPAANGSADVVVEAEVVEEEVVAATPAPAPKPVPASSVGNLAAGTLLEVVHVMRDGQVWAADESGNLYRVLA